MNVTQFIQQLINGLSQGSIYALIAVGYTMVYGVLQLINFAHGDVFMVGAMVSLYAATGRVVPLLPWWVHTLVLGGLLAAALVPLCAERFEFKPRTNSVLIPIAFVILTVFAAWDNLPPQHPWILPAAMVTVLILVVVLQILLGDWVTRTFRLLPLSVVFLVVLYLISLPVMAICRDMHWVWPTSMRLMAFIAFLLIVNRPARSASTASTLRSVLPLAAIYLISIPVLFIASQISRHVVLGSWFAMLFVLAFTVATCAVLGYLIERLAYRPLRDSPRINSLITAIGISLLLEYGGQNSATFGPTPQAYPDQLIPFVSGAPIAWHNIVIAKVDILVLVLTIAIMLGLSWLVLKTRMGLGLRAASYRFDTAALMGVNINSVVSFTFILGSCLAAIAGMLWGVKYSSANPLMGLMPGIKAFVAAVFGGIGNIAGAVVGAIVLGLVEVMVVGYLPGGSQYRDGVAFVILIAILLVKPSGLLGKNVVEKV